jgi:chitin disaccharide deacetylase
VKARRLIVNADDHGRTREVSRGIRQAHREGIVTSTTVMMNMTEVRRDLQLALKETPRLGLGVHLTLTAGKPLASPKDVPSLVDAEGSFWNLADFTNRLDEIDMEDVRREWKAQADRFVEWSGKTPTHFDSHHHTSYFTPGLFRLMLEMAREYRGAIRYGIPPEGALDLQGIPPDRVETYGIPPEGALDLQGIPPERVETIQAVAATLIEEYQIVHPDTFLGLFYEQGASREALLALLRTLPEGVSELMCHPGYADENLLAESTYNRQREGELAILTDPEIAEEVKRSGVVLVTFGGLP